MDRVKRQRSPDDFDVSAIQATKIRALETTFSPASYIRKSETPRRNLQKDTSGKILLKIGRDEVVWNTTNKRQFEIKKTSDPHIPAQATYMFDLLSKKASNLQSVCREFGARLCSSWHRITGKDAPMVTSDVRNNSQSIFRTWGRIKCGTTEKLKVCAVLLEGCKPHAYYHNLPETVRLDLTDIPSYSIFPGQIIAVECTNPTGNSLVAKSLFASGYPPPSPSPKFEDNLHIVVAAGPYTNHETLDYQPLFELMNKVGEMEPHVLILVGPFVPFDHPEIRNATVLDTFQELFQQIIDRIARYTKGKCTQVVLVSSSRDAHHDPVYPTPEFFLAKSTASNIHSMPDPCMIDIEGVTIGATSVDIIRHMSGNETSLNMKGMDRLGRLANHLLSQGCFYPLYPPSKEVNIDTALWEKYAFMYRQPHILILPSDMRHFCNWTTDCIVLNPERLNKHSYARIIVRSSLDGKLTKDNVDCEILKI